MENKIIKKQKLYKLLGKQKILTIKFYLKDIINKISEKERQEIIIEILDNNYDNNLFAEYIKIFDLLIGSKLNLNFNINHWSPSLLSLVVLRHPYIELFEYFVRKGADINFIANTYAFDDKETLKKELEYMKTEQYMTCLDFANIRLTDLLTVDYNYHVPKKVVAKDLDSTNKNDTLTISKKDYLYLHEQSEYLFYIIYTDRLIEHIKNCGGKTHTKLQKK